MLYHEQFSLTKKGLCMDDDNIRQGVLFSDLAGRPVVAADGRISVVPGGPEKYPLNLPGK
jgi:hypothetical protein